MIRLFRVFIPAASIALLVGEILLVTGAYIVSAYLILDFDPAVYLLYEGGLVKVLVVVVSLLIGLHFQDLYSHVRVRSRIQLIQQLCLAGGAAFLLQGLINYLKLDLRLPIRVMVLGSALALIGVFIGRTLFSAYVLQWVGRDRVLLVGSSPLLEAIGDHICDHPETGLVVAGYVRDAAAEDMLPGGKVLGGMEFLREIVAAVAPRRIVVGMAERRNRMPLTDLLELRLSGHIVEEAPAAYEKICGRICLKELRPSQLIFSGELGPRPQNVVYQRLWNALLAVIGIIAAAPLMAITAAVIRLSSPGPALYRQQRVGLRNTPFTLYKFRSMRIDAEAVSGPVWALQDDPRVTRFGRIIRELRIDELPQLFNVLKGEMSLVGPRPERPEFVRKLAAQIPYYAQRHFVRPGITGWAQINHKYGDTIEDAATKLEFDLYYIKNMSVSLDLYIIFQTVKAMLLSRGAQ